MLLHGQTSFQKCGSVSTTAGYQNQTIDIFVYLLRVTKVFMQVKRLEVLQDWWKSCSDYCKSLVIITVFLATHFHDETTEKTVFFSKCSDMIAINYLIIDKILKLIYMWLIIKLL